MRTEIKPCEGEILFNEAKERRDAALRAFANADDPLLVEAAIYEFRAANANMGYALKLVREYAAAETSKRLSARK